MGQDESTLTPGSTLVRDGSEGDLPVESPEAVSTKRVLCDNCDLPATYRCKMKCEDLSDVHKYPDIIDYWVPLTRIVQGKYIVAYMGCDTCIEENVKSVFIHKPEGWTETICMEDDYEDARV